MFITREIDYSMRIIRALYNGGRLTAGEVSERENIPSAITYKLLKQLTKRGVIQSFRGADGGYCLVIDCAAVSLKDLFEKMGIEMFINRCQQPGYHCENKDCATCRLHNEFDRVQNVLLQELDSRPLSELL